MILYICKYFSQLVPSSLPRSVSTRLFSPSASLFLFLQTGSSVPFAAMWQLPESSLPLAPSANQTFSNWYTRFRPQQTGPISATLVMTRPIKGPRDIQLDLEMITVNTVINFRGSSVIRLRIYVSQYPFWAPGCSLWHCLQLHQGTEKRRNQRGPENETDVRPFRLNVSWGVSMSPDHASILIDPSLWRTYFPSFYDAVIEKHYHWHPDLRSTVIFQGLQFISIGFKENRFAGVWVHIQKLWTTSSHLLQAFSLSLADCFFAKAP